MTQSRCQLYVYLARETSIGVVLRRGPSAWAQLSLWHTDTDAFEHGQWFKGRVYERRCDVSADGSLFVYFARKNTDSWLAVSRPPWFSALALWFVGTTYCAGAFFAGRDRLCFAGSCTPDQGRLPPWLMITTESPYIDHTPHWTDHTTHANRLLRDGWQRAEDAGDYAWRHRSPDGDFTLVMTEEVRSAAGPGGFYALDYTLFAEPQGKVIPLEGATWADWDQHGRLIVARDGCLLQWRPAGTFHELADFNPLTPEAAPPPASALTWPRRPRPGRGNREPSERR